MKTEHLIVLLSGLASLLWLRFVMRGPTARTERKLREARARFRRSLINRGRR